MLQSRSGCPWVDQYTTLSLKTQIPAKHRSETQCYWNCIQWNTLHLRTFPAHQNAESRWLPKTNAVSSKWHPMSNCSKWKRAMVEFPSCDMKEHNGTTPDTHTLIQQNKWLRGTDAQIMQTCDTVHNKSKHAPCLALRSVSTFQCILSAHILKAKTNQELCHLQITTTTTIQSHSLPTAIQTVRSSHEQHRPSRLPKELFLLFLPHFKLGFKNHTEYTMVCPIAILGPWPVKRT